MSEPQAALASAPRASVGDVVEFLAYDVVNRHILKADRQFFPFLAAAEQDAGAAVSDE